MADQVELLRRQLHRARNLQLAGFFIGFGQLSALTVHPPMNVPAVDGIRRILPLLLDPFQVGQPGAVHELVQDSSGNKRRTAVVAKDTQRKSGLHRRVFLGRVEISIGIQHACGRLGIPVNVQVAFRRLENGCCFWHIESPVDFYRDPLSDRSDILP